MHTAAVEPLQHLPVKKLSRWPMKELTSLRVGGKADLVLFPRDEEELGKVVSTARESGTPLYPMGGGTNLLVKDGGIAGAMVSPSHGFNYLSLPGSNGTGETILRAGAGSSLGRICLFALKNGLSGLEGLTGIPGSLGGCLTMNAGAGSTSVGENILRVKMLTEEGETVSFSRDEIDFGYRRAVYPVKGIFIEADFKLQVMDKKELSNRAVEAARKRRHSKFVFPFNAGSIFKNPQGRSAGALIEKCGLKGDTQGDAQISNLHGNIFVNRGHATAGDLLKLIEKAKEKVLESFGIELEEEIKIIGR